MALGGAVLRFGQTGLRFIELLAAIVALAIFSYFLAVLSDHKLHIPTWEKAVEGISGAAVLYLILQVFFTLCLGGVAILGFIAVALDIAFIAAFVYVAFETRHSANSCTGYVNTPLGSGQASSPTPYGNSHWLPNLHQACRLNTAVFAVSIILCFLFFFTAIVQILLVRHHKKEKRYGPGPSNNYTSGAGRRPFWKRNKRVNNTRDAELATAGAAGTHHAMRPSHDTGYTGTTTGNGVSGLDEAKYGEPGYGQAGYGYGQNTAVAPAHHTTTSATNY
jgi:hypothetical protein